MGGLENGSSTISSFPPPSGLPGVPDSAEASGIIRASLDNVSTLKELTGAFFPSDAAPGDDRRGNVCRFNAAGSNGSSISLRQRPASAPKLISSL